jgi:hypothetical protein
MSERPVGSLLCAEGADGSRSESSGRGVPHFTPAGSRSGFIPISIP